MEKENLEQSVRKKFRVWYTNSPYSYDKWAVQRKTWDGRWKKVATVYSEEEAMKIKKSLIREELETLNYESGEMNNG
jgi:hypothetical protein